MPLDSTLSSTEKAEFLIALIIRLESQMPVNMGITDRPCIAVHISIQTKVRASKATAET